MTGELEKYRGKFVELSSTVTGYDASIIHGTGMVDQHLRSLSRITGQSVVIDVLNGWDKKKPYSFLATEIPLIDNVVLAWYLGKWKALTTDPCSELGISCPSARLDKVLSAEAYREALAWRTVRAHPPGAKQPGFGSWERSTQ